MEQVLLERFAWGITVTMDATGRRRQPYRVNHYDSIHAFTATKDEAMDLAWELHRQIEAVQREHGYKGLEKSREET